MSKIVKPVWFLSEDGMLLNSYYIIKIYKYDYSDGTLSIIITTNECNSSRSYTYRSFDNAKDRDIAFKNLMNKLGE